MIIFVIQQSLGKKRGVGVGGQIISRTHSTNDMTRVDYEQSIILLSDSLRDRHKKERGEGENLPFPLFSYPFACHADIQMYSGIVQQANNTSARENRHPRRR